MNANAESLLQSALSLSPSIQRATGRSMAYAQIAEVYLRLGDIVHCQEALARAAQAAQAIKYPHERAVQFAWLGRLFLSSGDAKQGKSLLEGAVLLARAAAPSNKIPAMFEIVTDYVAARLQPEATGLLSELTQMVACMEKPEDVSGGLIEIAKLYGEVGRTTTAGETLGRAARAAKDIKDSWFKAERLTGVAEVCASLNDVSGAAAALAEAGRAVSQTEFAPGSAYFLLRIADVYQSLDQIQEVGRLLTQTLGLVRQNESSYERSGDLIEIAARQFASGNAAESHVLLKEAETTIEQIEKAADCAERLTGLAAAWAQAGRLAEAQGIACSALEAALSLPDRRSSLHIQGDLAALYGQIGLIENASAIVEGMVQIVQAGQTKTSGLGAIATSLSEAGQPDMGLRLAELIREPEIKIEALTVVAGSGQDKKTS